ncbi:hypothetical protein P691DRAFT_809473 [Macrolepiota fuliginosa MF-IS2]|uniref:F-box domain-containing protein n=1 Tax=Macrolepiota fuliginosa MF-IS2 TaxID=1400762 RepID=A0A9P5XKD2_9AGAR|nr:hypothetical protein P691DRAFT_809473 [Macrolepiota fuliginosa MF-IS2]
MPTLEDLPIEIILEVVKFSTPINPTGDRIGKDDLCNLRLVSSRLNETVSPVLFMALRLDFDDADIYESTAPDSLRCQEIIHALADGSTRAFKHTRRLSLCTQKLFWTENDRRPGVAELKQLVIEKIFDAVSALKDLRTVTYAPSPGK